MKKIRCNLQGLSLIESVVTIGIVLLLATGLVIGMNSSLANARRSASRVKGTEYAVDAIERLRKERDLSWSAFALLQGDSCMDGDGELTGPVYGESDEPICPMVIDSTYSRLVQLAYTPPDQMNIDVTVAFIENGVSKSVTMKTLLTKWR